ncbi:hypothetical protein J6590_106880 [Homalodisca vitripennis]|nr:hypothetical protein J6590_106880 [Homalodisca vitripennis]
MGMVLYEQQKGILNLHHTEVPEHLRGKSVGHDLAKEVFEYCSARNLKVLLTCEFLQKFYEENPQYKDLVVKRSAVMEGDWIEYYCREGQYTRVVEVARKCGGDVKWKYYEGLGLVLGGKLTEGISCLEQLLTHGEYGLAAAHLSLIAHQSCQVSVSDSRQ